MQSAFIIIICLLKTVPAIVTPEQLRRIRDQVLHEVQNAVDAAVTRRVEDATREILTLVNQATPTSIDPDRVNSPAVEAALTSLRQEIMDAHATVNRSLTQVGHRLSSSDRRIAALTVTNSTYLNFCLHTLRLLPQPYSVKIHLPEA